MGPQLITLFRLTARICGFLESISTVQMQLATVLQEEVFFNLLYHFGYCGREWIRDMTVTSINTGIQKDQNNIEFVEIMKPKAEKNVKASLTKRCYESNKNVGMYQLTDKSKCQGTSSENLPGETTQ